MALERIEITTGTAPNAAVIWLHGLGADGHDFEPIVPELSLPPGASVRFVFPHAPIRARAKRTSVHPRLQLPSWSKSSAR